jgi:tryptophan-rich sensory protein
MKYADSARTMPSDSLRARHRGWLLFAFIGATFATGGLASLWSPGSSDAAAAFDASLIKPFWAPPNVVFGPVWTALYALMAIAAWRVWLRAPSTDRSAALRLYWIQLLLNFFWSPLFFGLQWLLVATIESVLLAVAVVVTAMRFGRLDRVAGALMVPYALWVTFALVLTTALWWLNG